MFDKSENTGIDWFSEWPTLEAVMVYDSETGPLSKKSMSAPMSIEDLSCKGKNII